MKPTENQQLAIDIRDANVLVSAAAGSGKTSVLVERILQRISKAGGDTAPVDIDRMLIMTFTNAAAAEMRERIRDAIDKRMTEARGDKETDRSEDLSILGRQSLLVHHAMITTIHGFCKSVITDHFEELDLDPNFRVGDENECRLIMQDALDECLERAYAKQDPSFCRLVECFSGTKNDSGLADLLIPLYRFMIGDPDPENFLADSCRSYEFCTYEEFEKSDLYKFYIDLIREEISFAQEAAKEAGTVVDACPAIASYRPHIDAYLELFAGLKEKMEASPFKIRETAGPLADFKPPRLPSIRGDKLDDDEKVSAARFKDLREQAKSGIKRILDLADLTGDGAFLRMKSAKVELKALCDLVLDLKRIYEEKKRDKGIIDFNDMEHMAISILKNPDIAAVYRDHYAEIYVDEYQDSNMIQEMLVSLICRKDPGNVFCVGDVKQSIYRFRQARPDLFLTKYYTYTDEKGPNRRILLNDNFRSRRETVNAVNEVFFSIMKKSLGGIEYDEDARLNFGASYYEDLPAKEGIYRSEIIIGNISRDDTDEKAGIGDDLSNEEFTANIIADRISRMIRDGYPVYDKERKEIRPVGFGDFTILVRTFKKYETVFRRVFAGADIPLAVTGHEGYFQTVEIRTALAFLQAVDNPLNDIALAAVALSGIGGFTDKDMAELTAEAGSDICLYERIKSKREDTDELGTRCAAFLSLLDKYKAMSVYTTVHGLLSDLIDNVYGDIVKGMNRSAQRMANLEMLLSKAADYGRTSFTGLYQFVRYMDQIRKYEMDDGEASLSSGNDASVKLMTIHASKGLEFPVCFLAGIERGRNTGDEQGRLLAHPLYGLGINYTDPDRRIYGTTLPKELIREANRREAVAEEIRLLYVAMTRARDKLIMVGCGDGNSLGGPVRQAGSWDSYLDMLNAAYGPDGFKDIDVSCVLPEDLVYGRLREVMDRDKSADSLMGIVRDHERGRKEEGDRKVPEFLRYAANKYPYPIDRELRQKLSVSDLKHKAIEEEIARGLELAPDGEQLFAETEPDRYIPAFMRAEGETEKGGTFYGSAFHRIMELWDYSNIHIREGGPGDYKLADGEDGLSKGDQVSSGMVREFTEKMCILHRMSREQADAIRPDDVAAFLNSALGRRMKSAADAGRLYREQPFVIGMPQGDETVLVQGIIDAYFTDDEGITIVDYKTDRVSDEEMLVNRYRAQLEYYGMALSQIRGLPVRELIIYSTRLRSEIKVTVAKDGRI